MNLGRPMARSLIAAVAAILFGLSPAGAQLPIHTPVQPVPGPDPIPACLAILDPVASGPNQAPADTFADPVLFAPTPSTSNDYHWIHSSVPLQGAAATQKWGACLFFNPDRNLTGAVDMTDWRSALVVNNPSPTATAHVTITYRDPGGIILTTVPVTLTAEQTFARGAFELRLLGQGIGSVEVNSDQPIVGAILHHFGKMTLSNGQMVTDPDVVPFTALPGANSMRQLQLRQSATVLYSGPFPASNSSAEDFLNGVLPINCILNPNPTATNVTVTSALAPATVLSSTTVSVPGFGMYLDTAVWGIAEPFYLSIPPPAPFNGDVITAASSSLADHPILGDYFMVDVFGNGAPANLVPGGRFRMGAGMMQSSPALRLINPEHTESGPLSLPGAFPPPTPPVETMMSVANVTGADIGPVRVQFFSRTGGPPIATLTFPSLPALSVQRIVPGTSAIPKNFAGWARITACRPGLIGWAMREIWQQTAPFTQHFRKVYGEELDGAGGLEPGGGFNVVIGGQTWIRKVSPFLRAAGNGSSPNWWPSFLNAANHSSANVGPYWHRFYTIPPVSGVLAGQATFTGLRFANTSFTYVDPIVNLLGSDSNVSGRFDRTTGTAVGMQAVGDPPIEWGVPMYLGPDVEVELGPVIGVPGQH